MNYYTCRKCGTVLQGISRKEAEERIHNINKHYDSLSDGLRAQTSFIKRQSVEMYEKCNVALCENPAGNFMAGGVPPNGSTLNFIVID